MNKRRMASLAAVAATAALALSAVPAAAADTGAPASRGAGTAAVSQNDDAVWAELERLVGLQTDEEIATIQRRADDDTPVAVLLDVKSGDIVAATTIQ